MIDQLYCILCSDLIDQLYCIVKEFYSIQVAAAKILEIPVIVTEHKGSVVICQ